MEFRAAAGLGFIASNGWAATHNDQFSPIGFNVIFPAMVNYAKDLDLTLPLSHTLVDSLLRIRDSEIRLWDRKGGNISIVFHYGGEFKHLPIAHYRGGNVIVYDYVDAKAMGLGDLEEMTNEVVPEQEFWRYFVLINNGFRGLYTDRDVKEWFIIHIPLIKIDIYVETVNIEDQTESVDGDNGGLDGNFNANDGIVEQGEDGGSLEDLTDSDCNMEQYDSENDEPLVDPVPTENDEPLVDPVPTENDDLGKRARGKKPMKMRRQQNTVTCRVCGVPGHNATTCRASRATSGQDDRERKANIVATCKRRLFIPPRPTTNAGQTSSVNPIMLPPSQTQTENDLSSLDEDVIPTQQSQVYPATQVSNIPGPSMWNKLKMAGRFQRPPMHAGVTIRPPMHAGVNIRPPIGGQMPTLSSTSSVIKMTAPILMVKGKKYMDLSGLGKTTEK
ncbi:hypothetical protein DH2020_000382 [Rehmannia glutinosa]|uniref:PB1-like domain-containing protein n=1 Tax=Rehmannia glutinosa TaxID=99300 RepID=A0ABR0XWF4_REHGL